MTVETKMVAGRRKLRFQSYQELTNEVDRLVKARQLKSLGNWSLGQVLKHLAIVMHHSVDGFPTRPPLPKRLLFRLFKNRFVKHPMPAGIQLPKPTAAALVAAPQTTTQEGLIALRDSIRRLQTDSRRAAHPAFGKLSHDEWDQINFRHAELHLSFIEIQE